MPATEIKRGAVQCLQAAYIWDTLVFVGDYIIMIDNDSPVPNYTYVYHICSGIESFKDHYNIKCIADLGQYGMLDDPLICESCEARTPDNVLAASRLLELDI